MSDNSAGMAFPGLPSWSMTGVVKEVRALKAKSSQEIFAHVVKLVGMGGTFELQTREPSLVDGLGQGQMVEAVGGFEEYNGQLKLQLTGCKPVGRPARAAG